MTRRLFFMAAALAALAIVSGLGALFPEAAQAAMLHVTSSPVLGMVAGGAGTVLTAAAIPASLYGHDLESLKAMTTPRGLERMRRPLFDTAQYVSGTTTTLTFFNTGRNDPTLSNENGSGQLAAGIWHVVSRFTFDVIADATESGGDDETGILDDIQKLILVGRPILQFTVNGKPIFDNGIPLSFVHGSGGVQGAIGGTLTAPNLVQVGNNSFPDDGFSVDGNLIIPPVVGYSATITWAAAQTLKNGNTYVRLSLDGVRYRPVS